MWDTVPHSDNYGRLLITCQVWDNGCSHRGKPTNPDGGSALSATPHTRDRFAAWQDGVRRSAAPAGALGIPGLTVPIHRHGISTYSVTRRTALGRPTPTPHASAPQLVCGEHGPVVAVVSYSRTDRSRPRQEPAGRLASCRIYDPLLAQDGGHARCHRRALSKPRSPYRPPSTAPQIRLRAPAPARAQTSRHR